MDILEIREISRLNMNEVISPLEVEDNFVFKRLRTLIIKAISVITVIIMICAMMHQAPTVIPIMIVLFIAGNSYYKMSHEEKQ